MADSKHIILVVGLPGSGKTTLADFIREYAGGARINADQVRATISNDLKFSMHDRRVQAARMGALAAIAVAIPPARSIYPTEFLDGLNHHVIIDFVCPTKDTMDEFMFNAGLYARDARVHVIWMNTITAEQCRFPDTAKLYEPPVRPHITIDKWQTDDELRDTAQRIVNTLNLKVAK